MKDHYLIGHMKPSTEGSGASADETKRLLPKNVSITSVALGIRALVGSEIQGALDRIEVAAAELAKQKVDAITMGGTPPVVFGGYGFDKKIIERITKVAHVPATTSQTSAMKAMALFGVKKLALVAPWKEDTSRMLIKFLEDSGVKVLVSKTNNTELRLMGDLPLSCSYDLALQAFKEAPNADCIYIPCAAWPVSENIDPLEKETGLPVIANTQSGLWGVLRLMGVEDRIQGFGRLLRDF